MKKGKARPSAKHARQQAFRKNPPFFVTGDYFFSFSLFFEIHHTTWCARILRSNSHHSFFSDCSRSFRRTVASRAASVVVGNALCNEKRAVPGNPCPVQKLCKRCVSLLTILHTKQYYYEYEYFVQYSQQPTLSLQYLYHH